MKKKIFKNNKTKKSNIPTVYSCYNLNLIIKIIIEFFKNKKKSINNIFGIKRFNFQCEKNIQIFQFLKLKILNISHFTLY